jgi:hypothetical protein
MARLRRRTAWQLPNKPAAPRRGGENRSARSASKRPALHRPLSLVCLMMKNKCLFIKIFEDKEDSPQKPEQEHFAARNIALAGTSHAFGASFAR